MYTYLTSVESNLQIIEILEKIGCFKLNRKVNKGTSLII